MKAIRWAERIDDVARSDVDDAKEEAIFYAGPV